MVSLQDLLTILPIIALIITLTFYIMSIRTQNKTRRAQLFMSIYSKFSENKFWENNFEMRKSLDLWAAEAVLDSNYLTMDVGRQSQFNAYASFFEGIGVLLEDDQIDLKLVKDLMASNVVSSWEAMRPVIIRMREVSKDENQYRGFEYLYKRIKQ